MKYTPHTDEEISEMLKSIKAGSINDLFSDIKENYKPKSFNIDHGLSEFNTYEKLFELSKKNKTGYVSFLGAGYYNHYIPSAVSHLVNRSEFYTAYTPYQSEASQGTLQAIFEYQSMIARLTDMDASNASLYDGGTALYEAVVMAVRTNNRKKIIIDKGVNPLYRKMLITHTKNLNLKFIEVDLNEIYTDIEKISSSLNEEISALIVQNPNFFGIINDFEDIFIKSKQLNIINIISFYPVSLGLFKTPGEMKADIAAAEGQSLGINLSFGGPYLGIIACEKKLIRKLPGRIVGETIDKNGKRCFVLTLQAREQHIRREKATSNICSNQALCALNTAIYLSLLGKNGLKNLSIANYSNAEYLKEKLKLIKNIKVFEGQTFNEFSIKLNCKAMELFNRLKKQNHIIGFPAGLFYKELEDVLIINTTELTSKTQMDDFYSLLKNSL